MTMAKSKRREQRETAFVLVFEHSITNAELDEIIDNALDSRDISLDLFGRKLAQGVIDNMDKIDEVITNNIRAWSINRLSKVRLSVLRLAVYELMFESDIPVGVTINEAVELAKKYGDSGDSSYVNGVLSSVSKSDVVCKKEAE